MSGRIGVIVGLVLLVTGCGRVSTDYGHSSGLKGRDSINGFGALRKTYENAGFTSSDVRRLSDRLNRTQTIVWTPQILSAIDDEVTDWFEDWLQQGDRSLVMILPDSGSEVDYWIESLGVAPPQSALEYRRRAARATNDRFRWRMNRVSVSSNGWFDFEPLDDYAVIDRLRGPWAMPLNRVLESQAISNNVTSATTAPSSSIVYEFDLRAYAPPTPAPASTSSSSSQSSSPSSPQATTTPVQTPQGPTGPGDPYGFYTGSALPTSTPIDFQPLVRVVSGGSGARDSKCIVARITSPQWQESEILVIAGGSLLSNFAFTRPFNRQLAELVVAESTPGQRTGMRAGFLTTGIASVPVSSAEPGAPTASGFELMTTWPLSLVTIHALFLGLVVCLILFPIFGRPRRILEASRSRFGDHLDAVAALMNRARGEEYARRRISEYHRRMRGETSGPWVLPEPPRPVATTTAAPLRVPIVEADPAQAGATVRSTEIPTSNDPPRDKS